MNSKNIGFCIYCLSTAGLSDEHVIPKGLGGMRTLLNASCENCSKITSKFEGDLIGRAKNNEVGLLWDFRVHSNLPSRRGTTKEAKLLQLVEDAKTGKRSEKLVKPEDYVGVFMLPIFDEPGCITGKPNPGGLPLNEWMTYISNQDKALKGYKYGSRFRSRQGDFPRFLAKVGYGNAIFEFGYKAVAGSRLPVIILENSPEQSQWIGCDPKNTMDAKNKQTWAVEVGRYKGRFAAKIKILPEIADNTPEYIVVIK